MDMDEYYGQLLVDKYALEDEVRQLQEKLADTKQERDYYKEAGFSYVDAELKANERKTIAEEVVSLLSYTDIVEGLNIRCNREAIREALERWRNPPVTDEASEKHRTATMVLVDALTAASERNKKMVGVLEECQKLFQNIKDGGVCGSPYGWEKVQYVWSRVNDALATTEDKT